jgi:hypothetical protein
MQLLGGTAVSILSITYSLFPIPWDDRRYSELVIGR